MESWSPQSPGVTALPSSRNGLMDKPFIFGQTLKLPNLKGHPCVRNVKLLNIRAKASGLAKSSLGKTEAILSKADSKEGDLVFVAGATGRVGSRTVRELLKLGFRVRAGVRSANRAEALIQSVKQMKLENAAGLQPVEKLEIVECDLEKPDQMVPAIGKSSVVICSIGASEKEVFDVTGPCRIDYRATKNLVDAAKIAKVNHFILVSSLGTNKFGFPAAILNLFWGVLIWKRKAEEALIASGIPYTIVRPGGMERPTDAYKETHNITLSVEDTLFGGQVSNLQVAELMAVMAKNPDLSYCKIVEVIAETTAPLTPMEELLAKIPSQRVKPEVAVAVKDSTTSTSNVLVAEPPATPSEKESATSNVTSRRPLSPYTAYDDLKPPTSPTPTSPSSQKGNGDTIDATLNKKTTEDGATVVGSEPGNDIRKANQEVIPNDKVFEKEKPLSPYITFTFDGPREISSVASLNKTMESPTGGNDVASPTALESVTVDATKDSSFYCSPYFVYDDLKPPTTPSPSQPNSLSLPVSSGTSDNGAPKPSTTITPNHEKFHEKRKLKPLSPYTMYEDLKPPTSPTPFPNNF